MPAFALRPGSIATLICLLGFISPTLSSTADYGAAVETVIEHDDGEWLWFHPRAAAAPGFGRDGAPAVVMTLQKHLQISDYYSGLYALYSDDLGGSWTGPVEIPELAWRDGPGGTTIAVCDVTPGWHAPTGKVLALGAQICYSPDGRQVAQEERFDQTAYAVYDPAKKSWTSWKILEMPDDPKFHCSRNACSQWLTEDNGDLLVPLYYGAAGQSDYSVTVARCRFDGETLRYLCHGTEMTVPGGRGLCEPSLIRFQNRYYLTLRNDARGYVAVSDDGLHFEVPKIWRFDDGAELGSYNTQQHWLASGDTLYLVYTRRGADNDHIIRHRAPLFMAQVDTERCCVIRQSERVLIPERGAAMGNFGASAMTESEAWVTVGEGVWNDDMRKRGAKGALLIARIEWNSSRENQQMKAAEVLAASLEPCAQKPFITTLFSKEPLVCCGTSWYCAASPGLPEKLVIMPVLRPEGIIRMDTGASLEYQYEEAEGKGGMVTVPLKSCRDLQQGICIQWGENRWQKNMDQFAEDNLNRTPMRGGMLMTGSSTARMWDVERCFPGRQVLNRGFGGSCYRDLFRFADEVIAGHRPDTVVIYDGDNDIAGGLTPVQTAADCRASVERIRALLPDSRIIVLATKPSRSRWNLHEAMFASNAAIAQQLSALPNVQFLDLIPLIMDGEGMPDPVCFKEDALHLNDEGYRRWSAALEKYLPAEKKE
ncbi:MAG: hypothetical protein BWY07_01339 [Candidatus Hydrogenedentes bacterium ADurb.Bin170]|nr:MAG: hypothetical protein BWY07_01339 [Candidatus Hydrogenedentes bacterium ADurb.Bin170]